MDTMEKKIYVIDDDSGIVDVMKIILEEHGYKVDTSMDSNDIFRMIDKAIPDIVLLDILMYGKSGPEIVRSLKNRDKTRNIPVIMVSAQEDIRKIAESAGADDYLEKPFNINDLLKIIEKHLS